jgi:ABC-type Fe3+/spermidine/putrescine transport system ATPase subunit
MLIGKRAYEGNRAGAIAAPRPLAPRSADRPFSTILSHPRRNALSNRPAAVSLRGVSKRFNGLAAVDDVSLDVAKGEFLAIVGPSGSGKTTLMRLVGGFEAADTGSIVIDGEDVTFTPAEHRRVNTVFQSYALFPHLNVLDNVAYGPRMHGAGRRDRYARAQRLLELVRLPEAGSRRPGELSGGQQQRVALARALANEPEVLLLDEPLGALDRKLRDEMQRELRRVQAELGATFLYVTHDQEEAFGMADRLAVMRAGRIEQIGSPAEIYDRPVNAWVARFVGSANTIAARVADAGQPARLTSELGPLTADYLAEGLAAGAQAVVVVRPEATRFEPRAEASAGGPNRIVAELVDVAVLGPSLRLRAVAGGVAFESIASRAPGHGAATAWTVGGPVDVTFEAASARAYRADEREPAELLQLDREKE